MGTHHDEKEIHHNTMYENPTILINENVPAVIFTWNQKKSSVVTLQKDVQIVLLNIFDK